MQHDHFDPPDLHGWHACIQQRSTEISALVNSKLLNNQPNNLIKDQLRLVHRFLARKNGVWEAKRTVCPGVQLPSC